MIQSLLVNIKASPNSPQLTLQKDEKGYFVKGSDFIDYLQKLSVENPEEFSLLLLQRFALFPYENDQIGQFDQDSLYRLDNSLVKVINKRPKSPQKIRRSLVRIVLF